MRAVRGVLQALSYLMLSLLLAASLGSLVAGHPFLLEVERSNSMYPLLQRGDIALVLPVLSDASVQRGTIVLYHPERGPLKVAGFIVHRIVGGNAQTGYLTKGDANPTTDQAVGGTTPVPPAWIDGIVPTIGGQPLRVPLLGFAALWAATHLKHLYILPGLGAAFSLALVISDRRGGAVRSRRRRHWDGLVVAVGVVALVISVLTAALVLATSQQEVAPYMVAHSAGVLNGSSVGILQPGQTVHVTAARLYNTGFFPLSVAVTSTDKSASFAPDAFWLPPGGQSNVKLTLRAEGLGMHSAQIWIGLFPPFLPPGLLWWLEVRSYWLALAVAALMPSLPFLVYIALVPRLRHAALRLGRQTLRPLARLRAFF